MEENRRKIKNVEFENRQKRREVYVKEVGYHEYGEMSPVTMQPP